MDDLGLEKADHRFCESIVVGVTDAADRGFDAGLGQAFGVANADVLGSPIGMMYKLSAGEGLALVKGLFQGIENKLRPC